MLQRRWTVRSRPSGNVTAENFRLEQVPVPEMDSGQFLIETLYLTVSPPARTWLTTGGLSGKPVAIGELMRGSGLGRVADSRNSEFKVGDLVIGGLGWQEYSLSDGTRLNPVRKVAQPEGLPASTLLHVLGASGASAYFGLMAIGKPRSGDTLVVSAAAGSVGSIVCQLGRELGCRVIGIAGSDSKCRWLLESLGCASAINYKTEDVAERLHEICPGSVDVYFDNVGGTTLDAALGELAIGARVVLCGGTSQYMIDSEWHGPKNYFQLVYRQASMAGFYIFTYQDRFNEAYQAISDAIRRGALTYAEDITDGIEQAPDALRRVLAGENFGTMLVKVKPD